MDSKKSVIRFMAHFPFRGLIKKSPPRAGLRFLEKEKGRKLRPLV
jgi:hypothetical protein